MVTKYHFYFHFFQDEENFFFLFKQDYWFCQGQKLRDFGDAKLMLPKKILTLVKVSYYLFLQLSMKKDQRGLKDSFKIVFFFHYYLIQRIRPHLIELKILDSGSCMYIISKFAAT